MKYRYLKIFLLLHFAFLTARGQVGSYSLAAIPEALKNNAAVVVHLEDINLEVESIEKATMRVHKIYTVMNEEGQDALLFRQYTNKYLSIDEAEIRMYDAAGKQLNKFRKKDMATIAVGEGLIEDGYLTYYRIQPPSYPATVEVTYELKFRGTLSIPDYRYISAKEAVVASKYTLKLPADLGLRYKAVHTDLLPDSVSEGNNTIYTWSVKNVPPVADEEGSVSVRSRFPYVNIVTNQFSYYGFHGDLSSWKSFGAWIGDLYKGLDELPLAQQQFLQQLVSGATSDTEKIRRIYQYLQQNFRYVSIQLGVGGLRPYSAAFTNEKKYGDCKALSNYMKAALKAVGIKSYVAIINAEYDQEPVDPAFPANDFNHVILCVPGNKDSLWLECTSNTAAFGILGTFTENRNALLITEQGGVLVPTPKSSASQNFLNTHTVVTLAPDLAATAETHMETGGAYQTILSDMLKDKHDDQKEMLVYYFGYKQPDDFKFSQTDDAEKNSVQLQMQVGKLPEFNSGNNYFIRPRFNKIWSKKMPTAANRKLDYYFRFPFSLHDTTVVNLPAGFTAAVLPKERQLHNAYGDYGAKTWYNAKENVVYTATFLILQKHKIPAADYAAVRSFFDEVMQDDTQRIVVNGAENNAAKKAF